MGRELCLQLVKEGCAVATCDVLMENLDETKKLCLAEMPNAKITLHECDVSSEEAMNKFRDEVSSEHGSKLHLLFNNAGIGGGGSMTNEDERDDWERTFNVCWYGVYYGCRAFMPLLMNAEEGHVINTSSINGFWASIGPDRPHSAYSSAKFAVKGFSEALITDFRANAPHLSVSVVMPGHIGTSIAINSGKVLGKPEALDMTTDDIKAIREKMMNTGGPMSEVIMNLSDDQIREFIHQRGIEFRDKAPMTASEAAKVILDGVKAKQWRILVGEDAHRLDERVRANPVNAYETDFLEQLTEKGDLGGLVGSKN